MVSDKKKSADKQAQLPGIPAPKGKPGRTLERDLFTREQLALIDAAKDPRERNAILSRIRMQRKRQSDDKKSFSVEVGHRHVDFVEAYAASQDLSNATAFEQMCDSLKVGFTGFTIVLRGLMRELVQTGPHSFADELRDVSHKIYGIEWVLKLMRQDIQRQYFHVRLADIQQKYESAYNLLGTLSGKKPEESKAKISAWLAENLPEDQPQAKAKTKIKP